MRFRFIPDVILAFERTPGTVWILTMPVHSTRSAQRATPDANCGFRLVSDTVPRRDLYETR